MAMGEEGMNSNLIFQLPKTGHCKNMRNLLVTAMLESVQSLADVKVSRIIGKDWNKVVMYMRIIIVSDLRLGFAIFANKISLHTPPPPAPFNTNMANRDSKC